MVAANGTVIDNNVCSHVTVVFHERASERERTRQPNTHTLLVSLSRTHTWHIRAIYTIIVNIFHVRDALKTHTHTHIHTRTPCPERDGIPLFDFEAFLR